MSRLPDLVLDSRLRTEFRDSIIIHSYLEIDNVGGRFSRKEHWKWERDIGRGGFGQVRLQRCVTEGVKQNSLRAVKIVNKPSNPSGSLDCERELEAIVKFSHDRYKRWFVKSFGWFENPISIFITMEYCRHGDLHHYLISQRTVAVEDVQQLTYQMLEALDQMHQNDFAHRDLKPGNILIKSMPPEEKWWIVLADFGISKRADESSGPTTAIKGTATFMAPELLGYLDQVKPKSIADFKTADMWALGEIIFQMLTGETAFRSPVELMTYCNAQREFPSNRLPISATDDGHEFVTSLMMALPQDRITTTQCIQHRWLESLRVEEELAALNLEQSSPPVPEISSNETASAQWSRLSNLEHKHTETTAQRRPTTPTHLGSSGIRQTRLKSISSSPPIQQYLNTDQEPLTFAITPMQTLEDDIGWVESVAFSHDSTRLAFESSDNAVKIWDVNSGACLQTLKGHSGWVSSVAFSHNTTWLASGSEDRTVKIWDVNSGACLQTLKGHSGWVSSVAFSHNSTWLASGSEDRTVKIWDASSGACLQTLESHSSWVNSVAFSHDSTRLASGSRDNTVKIWDASSGACLQTLEGHSSWVNSVAFSHDSTWLASGSSDRTVKIWDASSGACLQTLKGHSRCVNSVAFSHNSTWLASGSIDKTIKIWDATNRACLQTLKGHSDWVNSVAFSHDSTWLASGSRDDTVKIWSASRRSRAIAIRSTQ